MLAFICAIVMVILAFSIMAYIFIAFDVFLKEFAGLGISDIAIYAWESVIGGIKSIFKQLNIFPLSKR